MKRLIINRKGESLIESLISILLLSILLFSVSMIITTALRISGDTVAENARLQEVVNKAATEDFTGTTESITFTSDGFNMEIDTEIEVNFTNADDIVAFYPEVAD